MNRLALQPAAARVLALLGSLAVAAVWWARPPAGQAAADRLLQAVAEEICTVRQALPQRLPMPREAAGDPFAPAPLRTAHSRSSP